MEFDNAPQRRLAMSLRQIEVFRAIMIAGSISEAARLLFVAQPSVTRVLQVTEDRLGFPLFERSRGRLHPTPEARRIFEEVESAYAGVQRVDELVQALIEGRSGKLNIVCSPSLGVHLMPHAIARFNRQYPALPIHFEPLTHNNLIPRVLFGKNYLGVSMFDVTHPNLEVEPLSRVPLMCVAPRGRLGKRSSVTLDELKDERWIDYGHETPLGQIVGAAFGGMRRPAPIVEVRSALTACQLVREGVGIALVDPFCIDGTLHDSIDVKPVEPPRMLSVHALYARSEPLSHPAHGFLKVLRAVFEEAYPQR
ncbi:LysR substrate-binding domain-containing protein [Paraburkholderia sp.]|uniref:LysR substrate-binding domain-containing protein n=1 Tax=Paraburkholderia sp. TaxID=1926495 RepID=UPI0039E5DB0A